jgi:hypothetical protein
MGEIGVVSVAPAIANAMFQLTGKRLRHLPMSPGRVKKALAWKTKNLAPLRTLAAGPFCAVAWPRHSYYLYRSGGQRHG